MYQPNQLPAGRQLQMGSCRLGGDSICFCLTGVLLWPPHIRRPSWTACMYLHDSYFMDVLHLNCNILCLFTLCIYLVGRAFMQSSCRLGNMIYISYFMGLALSHYAKLGSTWEGVSYLAMHIITGALWAGQAIPYHSQRGFRPAVNITLVPDY